jgi:signal peptidase II
MRPRPLFLLVLAISLGLDQWTKALARAKLVEHRDVPFIDGFWDWRLSFNKGAAFSLGWGTSPWIFAGLAVVMSALMTRWAWRSRSALVAFATACIASGAIGNAIDRVVAGKVTDFVAWHLGSFRWPAFNIADVALVVGVILFVFASWREERAGRAAAS